MTEEVTEKQQTMKETAPMPAKNGSGVWIGIIILLVVVLMAGAGFYLYQLLRAQGDDINKEDQRNIEITRQVSGFQEQLASMQTQLKDASSTISNADERFEQKMAERAKAQEEKLDATRKDLTGAVVQIQRQLGKTRGDWLIADAEYLLSVAGQRLHLMGDVETTREALEAADQRLRESGDAAVFKVRDQIAKELASLKAIPEIDLVGMYAKLQSLSGRVNQLTLFLPYDGKPMPHSSEHDKHPVPSQTSSNLLNGVLKQLDGYVTVRHTAQPIKAILTKEEAEFIRQQLALKLEMAKLALVQKNQLLYQTSLEDALAWVDKNFNKNAQTQQFVTELNQLNATKLNAQLPDISLSLKLLRDISKLRIETDKALVPVDLEAQLNPATKNVKPVTVAPTTPVPVVAPAVVPETVTAKPEVKAAEAVPTTPVKPAVQTETPAAPATAPEVKATPAVKVGNKPEVKAVAPQAEVKPVATQSETKAAEAAQKVTPPTVSEPKKVPEAVPANKTESPKTDAAQVKKSQPVVIKPPVAP